MESYKILERIGEGTHGQVVQAMERSTGQIVAIKCVRSSDKASKNLLREIESLKALDSDYVCYINIKSQPMVDWCRWRLVEWSLVRIIIY